MTNNNSHYKQHKNLNKYLFLYNLVLFNRLSFFFKCRYYFIGKNRKHIQYIQKKYFMYCKENNFLYLLLLYINFCIDKTLINNPNKFLHLGILYNDIFKVMGTKHNYNPTSDKTLICILHIFQSFIIFRNFKHLFFNKH